MSRITKTFCWKCHDFQIDDQEKGTLTIPGKCADQAACMRQPLHLPIAPPPEESAKPRA